MATAAIPAEPGDMECPVCHEEFTVPKILPCAHIVCRDCLVTWLTSDTDALCPLCRHIIADIDERFQKSAENIADALPTDLSMAAMVKSSSRLKKRHVCCVCPNMVAVALCLDCDDMLCSTCAPFHCKLRVTRHHKVEDLASLTAKNLAARSTAMCTVHADETCKLFCVAHRASICQVCATTRHRACAEIVELEEKARAARNTLDQLLLSLQSGKTDIEETVSDLDQQLCQIDETEAENIREIDKMYDLLNHSLTDRCQELKKAIKDSGCEARRCVIEEKTTADLQLGTLIAHEHLLARVKQAIPYSDLDEMTSMLQARVEVLDFARPKWGVCIKKFQVDSQVLPRVKDELSKVGQLSDHRLHMMPRPQASATPQGMQMSQSQIMPAFQVPRFDCSTKMQKASATGQNLRAVTSIPANTGRLSHQPSTPRQLSATLPTQPVSSSAVTITSVTLPSTSRQLSATFSANSLFSSTSAVTPVMLPSTSRQSFMSTEYDNLHLNIPYNTSDPKPVHSCSSCNPTPYSGPVRQNMPGQWQCTHFPPPPLFNSSVNYPRQHFRPQWPGHKPSS